MQIFWLWLLCIGLMAGLLAGAIRRRGWSEVVGYLTLGLSGSIIGGSISRAHSPSSDVGLIAGAVIGAIVLIVIIEILKKD